jgi:hypothetical protein
MPEITADATHSFARDSRSAIGSRLYGAMINAPPTLTTACMTTATTAYERGHSPLAGIRFTARVPRTDHPQHITGTGADVDHAFMDDGLPLPRMLGAETGALQVGAPLGFQLRCCECRRGLDLSHRGHGTAKQHQEPAAARKCSSNPRILRHSKSPASLLRHLTLSLAAAGKCHSGVRLAHK